MKLIEVDINELERLVRVGFEGDEVLLQNQQFFTEMEVTIQRNIQNIANASNILDLKYFEVVNDSKVVGFTVLDIGKKLLYSFGINIKFRTKEVVIGWFEKLKNIFDNEFYTVLHDNNKRAIQFLERNGMVLVEREGTFVKLVNFK